MYWQDWVEITLCDYAGNAAPNAKYELYFSSGEIRKGTLDSNCKKRESNVPPGKYSVLFSEYPEAKTI